MFHVWPTINAMCFIPPLTSFTFSTHNACSWIFVMERVRKRMHVNYRNTCLNSILFRSHFQGDIFSGLNDGILSRAEALAAVDMQKHQTHSQMSTQLKHDVMYHHGMAAPPQRPLQVSVASETYFIWCNSMRLLWLPIIIRELKIIRLIQRGKRTILGI